MLMLGKRKQAVAWIEQFTRPILLLSALQIKRLIARNSFVTIASSRKMIFEPRNGLYVLLDGRRTRHRQPFERCSMKRRCTSPLFETTINSVKRKVELRSSRSLRRVNDSRVSKETEREEETRNYNHPLGVRFLLTRGFSVA